MPDEQNAAPAAPQFDMDALAGQITEGLKATIQQSMPQYPAPSPAVPQQAAPDAVRDLLDPYLSPVARQARLAEEAATDAAEFYTSHPELDKGERDEVEKRFKALKAANVPFKREDILNHYRGENIEKEVEKRIERRAKAATAAMDAAANVGSGSPGRGGEALDARSLSTADLSKALDGISF